MDKGGKGGRPILAYSIPTVTSQPYSWHRTCSPLPLSACVVSLTAIRYLNGNDLTTLPEELFHDLGSLLAL